MRPDLVWIDGCHSYEDTARDIRDWLPLLQDGGLLCGHDFTEAWPGVQRAVRELVPNHKAVEGTAIWWAKK